MISMLYQGGVVMTEVILLGVWLCCSAACWAVVLLLYDWAFKDDVQ